MTRCLPALVLVCLAACGTGRTVADPTHVPEPELPADPTVDPVDVQASFERFDTERFWTAVVDLIPAIDTDDLREATGTFDVDTPDVYSVEAEVRAAMFTSAYAAASWPALNACMKRPDAMSCATSSVLDLAAQAWRGPLNDIERDVLTSLVDAQWIVTGPQEAVRSAMQTILLSPRFLYLMELGDPTRPDALGRVPLTGHEVAARLALFLWNGLPDAVLVDAANHGELSTAEDVAIQAERMLSDPRAERALTRFHQGWLGADDIAGHWVDVDHVLPGYPPASVDNQSALAFTALMAGSRAEIGMFTSDVVLHGGGTFAELFTDTWTTSLMRERMYAGEVIAIDEAITRTVYAGADAEPLEFARTQIAAEHRAGVLTLPGVLAPRSSAVEPSPVRRGVFTLDAILCQKPDPPPPGVTSLVDRPVEGLTNRQRLEAHVSNPSCAACHEAIDGVGFAYEHYDALGAWRDTDQGQTIDASGTIHQTDVDGPIHDAIDLAVALSRSEVAMDCYADQWLDFAAQNTHDVLTEHREAVRDAFVQSGGAIPKLLIQIATSPAFLTRMAVAP